MSLTKKNWCRHCRAKYAQEMGLCRGCQQRRIDNLPPLNPEPATPPVDNDARAASRLARRREDD